jgi:hypothetical protein
MSGEAGTDFRLTIMPNEPDNRMDELLRAYAQKRKADAGDSLNCIQPTGGSFEMKSQSCKNESQRRPPSFSACSHTGSRRVCSWLFAVLGLAVWLSLPARQRRSGEQLLAQGEHSRLKDKQAAPKSDVAQPPAEVAQTMRRALQPTNSGKDSDGLRRSPRSFSDEVEERRGAEKGIVQLNENIAFAAAELKKKQAEEAAPGGESPQPNFQDAQRQSGTDLVVDIAARPTPIPAPGQLPAVPAAAGPTVADLNGTAAAAEGAQPGKQLASLRDSMPVPPAPSRAVDEREKLEAFFNLGTFTNSRVAVDGAALKSQISNTSHDFERSQIANVVPAGGNIGGRESDWGSNRGYAGNATSSMTVQLRQQDQATVLSKNEATTNLPLNRVASPQSPSFAKDQTGVPADYFAGAAVQNQVAPQIQSSGRIANAPVARAERADKPGDKEHNLALMAEQNLRGQSFQTGRAEDFREAQSGQVAAASS